MIYDCFCSTSMAIFGPWPPPSIPPKRAKTPFCSKSPQGENSNFEDPSIPGVRDAGASQHPVSPPASQHPALTEGMIGLWLA